MEVSINTRKAYSEIDEFLELLGKEQRNKIPKKLRNFFKEEKDQEYKKVINPNVPIKNQNLKEETLGIIALLNLQYWCENEQEKNRLKEIYEQNEKKYQEILRQQYNPEDIFKKKEELLKENHIKSKENVHMIEYRESIFKKIINRILNILHIR